MKQRNLVIRPLTHACLVAACLVVVMLSGQVPGAAAAAGQSPAGSSPLLDRFGWLSLLNDAADSGRCPGHGSLEWFKAPDSTGADASALVAWDGRHIAALIGTGPPGTGELPPAVPPGERDDHGRVEANLPEFAAVPEVLSEASAGEGLQAPLRPPFQWTRVMAAAETQIAAMLRCNPAVHSCDTAVLNWQKLLYVATGVPLQEQLQTVNSYFNRWPYRADSNAYGRREYWATPREFLQHSGDCEDYCIAKYFALKHLGVPVERMNIVLLLDAVRNVPHAVLTVSDGQEVYVLDNLSNLLLPLRKYTHYQPLCSVNERCRINYVSADRAH